MLRFIRPVLPPTEEWLPHLDESYVKRHFTNFGPAVTRLEQALAAEYACGRSVVLTANATAGLTAALLALGVHGRVALPAFTFPATASAILQAGCTPVFCDVRLDTWELNLNEVARAHAQAPLAGVVAVRAFGLCRDFSPLHDLARRLQIPMIVDAAAALGGRLDRGEFAGGQGDAEVFSLHATKAFGIGEGGAVFAPPELVPAIRRASNFGLQDGDVTGPGFNGKLSDFHAAIGLALLPHFPSHIARRRSVAKSYRQLVNELSSVSCAHVEAGRPVWQTFPMLLPPLFDAQQFVADAAASGVELRRYYHPALPDTAWLRGRSPVCPASSELARRMVCLPVYSDMTREETGLVCDAVRHAWARQATTTVVTTSRAG